MSCRMVVGRSSMWRGHGASRPPARSEEKVMQYLVTIYHPDDYDASLEDETMERDIDALNDEMVAAGVRLFVGGLGSMRSARSFRTGPDGGILITDGPYLET